MYFLPNIKYKGVKLYCNSCQIKRIFKKQVLCILFDCLTFKWLFVIESLSCQKYILNRFCDWIFLSEIIPKFVKSYYG